MQNNDVHFSSDAYEYLTIVPPIFTRLLVYIIFFIVIAGILFLYLGRTNNNISTQFILIPEGGLKKIQGTRSGKIIKILCDINDKVKVGDVLFNIKSHEVISEISEIEKARAKLQNMENELTERNQAKLQSLRELTSKKASLESQILAKQNELKNIDYELSLKNKYFNGEREIKKMLINQLEQEYEISCENKTNEINRINNQVFNLKADLKTLETELLLRKKEYENNVLLFKNKEILEREYNNSKILYEKIKNDIKKTNNEINLLIKESYSKKEEAEKTKNLLLAKISSSKKELQLAQLQFKETEVLFNKKKIDLQVVMKTLKFELESTKAAIKEKEAHSAADKLLIERNIKSLEIDFDTLMSTAEENIKENIYQLKSPYEGIITQINVNTIGSVVTAGQILIHIAPENEPIVAEAFVPNLAIGMIKLNLPVQLKYDAYPYQKFGIQKGKLISISPDAIRNENSEPLYRTIIELENQFINTYQGIKELKYGMKGIAEIVTSRDRIIARFIKNLSDMEEMKTLDNKWK